VYSLDDYFGKSGAQLQAETRFSSEAPTPSSMAGPPPGGTAGLVPSFTDWRGSPVFWLAVFAVFALGMIHLEGNVKAALN
jgi:hypothetical protein